MKCRRLTGTAAKPLGGLGWIKEESLKERKRT